MAEHTLSARLVEIESMLDRSRRRFDEGSKLVEEAHKLLGDIQQALIGSPRSMSPEDSEEAASKLLASLKATGGEMPETLCGGRLAVDQVQRGSAAQRGGLRRGDIVVAVNSAEVDTLKDFQKAVVQARKSGRAVLLVQRGYQLIEFALDLG